MSKPDSATIASVVKKLTEGQAYWVRSVGITETGLFSRMAIGYLDGGGINGAIKKGLLEWTEERRKFLRLTEMGAAVFEALRDVEQSAAKALSSGVSLGDGK